jgi:hypothetical protein
VLGNPSCVKSPCFFLYFLFLFFFLLVDVIQWTNERCAGLRVVNPPCDLLVSPLIRIYILPFCVCVLIGVWETSHDAATRFVKFSGLVHKLAVNFLKRKRRPDVSIVLSFCQYSVVAWPPRFRPNTFQLPSYPLPSKRKKSRHNKKRRNKTKRLFLFVSFLFS